MRVIHRRPARRQGSRRRSWHRDPLVIHRVRTHLARPGMPVMHKCSRCGHRPRECRAADTGPGRRAPEVRDISPGSKRDSRRGSARRVVRKGRGLSLVDRSSRGIRCRGVPRGRGLRLVVGPGSRRGRGARGSRGRRAGRGRRPVASLGNSMGNRTGSSMGNRTGSSMGSSTGNRRRRGREPAGASGRGWWRRFWCSSWERRSVG